MAQDKVIIRRSGHQQLDELDATDIPDLSATYDASGAAASAQAAAATDATTKANAAQAAAIASAATDATTKANAAAAASQPLDSDLTAIAALSTTATGRSLLAGADAAALRTILALGTAATHATGDYEVAGAAAAAQAASQPLDSDLTAIAALATTSFGRGLLALADAATVRTTLGVAAAAKFGRFKHGGTVDYALPGNIMTATSTVNPSTGTVYYHPCYTPTQIVIDQLAFVVTTGPASNAKVRVGVTVADTDNQPSGAPLGDVEVAVATSFTGIKTATVNATIPPGPFLLCINMDVGMAFRSWRGMVVSGGIDAGLGTSSNIGFMSVAQAYPAANFPTPGLAWTSLTGGAADHWIVCRVGTP